MALPKSKKKRRTLIFWVQGGLLLVTIALFIIFKLSKMDVSVSAGLVGCFTVALVETCLRWVEEGK